MLFVSTTWSKSNIILLSLVSCMMHSLSVMHSSRGWLTILWYQLYIGSTIVRNSLGLFSFESWMILFQEGHQAFLTSPSQKMGTSSLRVLLAWDASWLHLWKFTLLLSSSLGVPIIQIISFRDGNLLSSWVFRDIGIPPKFSFVLLWLSKTERLLTVDGYCRLHVMSLGDKCLKSQGLAHL